MGKSNWPDPSLQLDATVLAFRLEGKGGLLPLNEEERTALIHALIEKFKGVQDQAMGTIIIPLLDDGDGPSLQLWVHEWE